MNEKDAIVEAWKQSIATKAHFDEITMKIRALFLTLFTAMLGASSVLGSKTSSAIYVGIVLIWVAFYLMDRWWYHYLLLGAVLHASSLEARASDIGLKLPAVTFNDHDGTERIDDNIKSQNSILGLTYRISTLHQESMFGIKAKYKLDFYYFSLLFGLVVFILFRIP